MSSASEPPLLCTKLAWLNREHTEPFWSDSINQISIRIAEVVEERIESLPVVRSSNYAAHVSALFRSQKIEVSLPFVRRKLMVEALKPMTAFSYK